MKIGFIGAVPGDLAGEMSPVRWYATWAGRDCPAVPAV